MQIFVLGVTKVGKSTLARLLKESLEPHRQFGVYEAGQWAREEFSLTPEAALYSDEFDPAFKNALTDYAMGKLKGSPGYSLERYKEFRAMHPEAIENVMISGVRNPDDFIGMLAFDRENIVVRIESGQRHAGSLGVFEEGLGVIDRYVDWKILMSNSVRRVTVPVERIGDVKTLAGVVSQILRSS
jgi:hypothetical protein